MSPHFADPPQSCLRRENQNPVVQTIRQMYQAPEDSKSFELTWNPSPLALCLFFFSALMTHHRHAQHLPPRQHIAAPRLSWPAAWWPSLVLRCRGTVRWGRPRGCVKSCGGRGPSPAGTGSARWKDPRIRTAWHGPPQDARCAAVQEYKRGGAGFLVRRLWFI